MGTLACGKVQNMKRKHYLQASFTVEAALLFPFILAVIVLLIYEAFFIHDRAVMHSAAYEAALRGSEITDDDGDIETKVRETGEREIEGMLLATKNPKMEIEVDSKEVRVTYRGDFIIPGGVILPAGINKSGTGITVKARSTRLDPASFIRECRVIEEHVK